jgi:hypothetical protein
VAMEVAREEEALREVAVERPPGASRWRRHTAARAGGRGVSPLA